MLFVFVEKITASILKELSEARGHANPEIKLCFDSATRRSKPIMTIKNAEEINGNCAGLLPISWDIDRGQCQYINTAYSVLSAKNNFSDYVLLDSNAYPKGQLAFFIDKQNDKAYPKQFYKIPAFKSYSDIINYGISNKLIKAFSLDDKKRFKKLNGKQFQGQPIYKELNTGCYWYLDNLHKNHYEVFDPTGDKHLAEASLDGIPDYSKADPRHVSIKKYI